MTAAERAPLSVVLVISAYPPHHAGGYELRCRDVARELARRGHRVTVLTGRAGGAGTGDDAGVRVVRKLRAWPRGVNGRGALLSFVLATSSDVRALRRETRRAKADVVCYWHQSGLSSALLAVRPPGGCGVACDVSSEWLADAALTGGNWFRVWEKRAGSWWKRAAKAVVRAACAALLRTPVRRPPFPPGRCWFTSEERKADHLARGVAVEDAAVIRSGIELDKFPLRAPREPREGFRLLFVGRVKRQKGLHTAVIALGYLGKRARLRAVGPVEEPEYVAEVAELARATGTLDRIEIAGAVEHERVPALLADADALVFPSEKPEAFSRLVLEAFATGTPVVGTTLGGTGEVLLEGATGLTFPPGNARELARQAARLMDEPGLAARLTAAARKLVEEKYSLGFTVDQIEALLREASARAKAAAEPPPGDGAARA